MGPPKSSAQAISSALISRVGPDTRRSRTTPTGGKDQNFLSQIISGASKLSPGIPGGGGV